MNRKKKNINISKGLLLVNSFKKRISTIFSGDTFTWTHQINKQKLEEETVHFSILEERTLIHNNIKPAYLKVPFCRISYNSLYFSLDIYAL